jgi:universal stress protein E
MVDPVPLPLELQKQHTKVIRQAFSHLTQTYHLGARHTHLKEGTPSDDLPAFVKKLKANVLVMGAVSRSTLKRLFIGATAEQVIDAVDCDVLVVKPDGFKCPVPKSTHRTPIVLPPI